jgi:hypothetical protein
MPPPAERVTALRWLVRRARLRTVPGRIRAYATVAVVAVAALFATASLYVSKAQDGLQIIGHGSGRQVVATSDLYFALSDMDAQVAGILLIGREQTLGVGQAASWQTYQKDRTLAHKALVTAADLAKGDTAGEQTVQNVLNGLGSYEVLVGKALNLNEVADHPAGQAPTAVLTAYRDATDLMKTELLPQAYNLTLDSGTIVRRTYEAERSSVLAGRSWVGVAGLVVIVLLAGLQLFLTVGFRRLISPLLALATVGTLALSVTLIAVLSGEANHLRVAKTNGFDSVLALSRARAISNNAGADETRYLLDPGRADTYEQVYLDKSQEILYVDTGTNLDKYYSGLNTDKTGYDTAPNSIPFLGFYGDEARHITVGEQGTAFTQVFAAYQKFQQDDQRMRELVQGRQQSAAIAERMGQTEGSSSHDFNSYDQSLTKLIGIHQGIFDGAIRDGDGELNGWDWGLPATAAILAGLILAGVRPRLKEFR